ncbi:LmbU family transcriptional regulator [Streptomyces griseoviridis]|uniref:LmbU n=2 Tax=Streptomyces TaxID=1883 RepID=A0ABT9LNA7_STRGD|nr:MULTISPECIES: LmbU family transcriptional regulator [Streptomyces]MDP9685012.1 hypothetical protein [Streptomyces griseoviridis]GGU70327.1 hypothetical protein GCM10010259_69950 [Streptomyces daghestanicus]GHI33480.1 hypothetical protein Sdagh_52100 [Streptomyces daghestanicus]
MAGEAARGTGRRTEPVAREREHGTLDVRAATRRTALTLSPGLPLAQWRHLGRQMFVVTDSSAWWLGDWLIYGRREYPDRYRRALTESGLDYQTLRNYAWVAGKFEPSRRRARLSFQHHAEVAGIPPDEQDEWLARAEREGWSRNELRRRVRAHRRDDRALPHPLVPLRVPSDRRVRWQQAAEAAGLDLLDWIVSRLDEAAGEPVRPEPWTDADIGA